MSRTIITSTILAGLVAFAPALPVSATDTLEEWAVKARDQIIDKNYYPHSAINKGIEGKVTVRLDIAKSGFVQGIEIIEPSGSDVLDQTVFQMAAKMKSLPSLPAGMEKHSITVPFTFELEDAPEKAVSERTDIYALTRLG